MLSKRKRFEIFKRDGFTCQYCGAQPPSVVLHVDHINPRAAGGDDDDLNLVTSCEACNLGKSDKKLGDVVPRPDADLKYLEAQQEIAEANRYMAARQLRDQARDRVVECLRGFWYRTLSEEVEPNLRQWNAWLNNYSAEEIEYAIARTVPKFTMGELGHSDKASIVGAIKYISGILKKRKVALEEERNAQRVIEESSDLDRAADVINGLIEYVLIDLGKDLAEKQKPIEKVLAGTGWLREYSKRMGWING